MDYRLAKILYLNRRDEDEKRDYGERELWRDKRILMIDVAGNSFKLDGPWFHTAPVKVQNKCIDITTDGDHFFAKHLNDNLSQEIRKIHAHKHIVENIP